MNPQFLIDGCNFLHSLQARGGKNALPKEAVFEKLASFASSTRQGIWVILDGPGADREWEKIRTPFFQILYSQSVSADTLIEKYLYENKSRAGISVVTEDRAILSMAKGMGVLTWSTAAFLEKLKEAGREDENVLFKWKVKGHRFNRPFEDRLKDF